ncbi:MAG: DNA primase [Candidatus Omnitrophica bacterium]|nr:DNA primase [Candidatus Omnitrophota bacterium]
MIPDAVLDQIQNRIDIVEVISNAVPLRRAGRSFKAPCPFHQEKTPSFYVNPEKQIFHCFGCGAGGNVFSFLMKQEKKDFPQVVEELAERAGVELPKSGDVETRERLAAFVHANALAMEFYHRVLLKNREGEAGRAYLKKRRIEEGTLLEFRLGFAPDAWDSLAAALKGKVSEKVLEKLGLTVPKKDGGAYDRFRRRILFPILDAKGTCVAFGGRVLDETLPKYLNSPESELYVKGRHLYGLFQAQKAIREEDAVILVEGYMDLAACWQGGVRNVVASLGTALTREQARLVKRRTPNVFILYDGDKAGELAALRGLELFLEEGVEVKVVELAAGHDPDSFIREFGVERFREGLKGAKTLFEYKLLRLMEKHDARSLEGRVKIANEMAVLLSKVPNEILRSAWRKELAERLSISEEALAAEIHKGMEKPRGAAAVPSFPAKKEAVPSGEKLLIGLMLDNLHFVTAVKAELHIEDFQHHRIRAVARKLFETSGGLSAARVVNFFKEDPESVEVVSSACAEADTVSDKEKAFSDCLSWMKRTRLQNRREGLRAQIMTAQEQGDQRRLKELLYDFNQLNKGMKV